MTQITRKDKIIVSIIFGCLILFMFSLALKNIRFDVGDDANTGIKHLEIIDSNFANPGLGAPFKTSTIEYRDEDTEDIFFVICNRKSFSECKLKRLKPVNITYQKTRNVFGTVKYKILSVNSNY